LLLSATKLLLLDLILPFIAFFTATVAAREIIKLLGISNLEEVTAFLAAKGDLRSIETLYYL
jgi:hypothetical protein